MPLRIGQLCALSLALTLGACATMPTRVPLAVKAETNIASTEVVAPIAQSEVYIYVPPTTAGQSNGLIGALIDAGVDAYRAGTAEKDVKTLRDAAVDLNFDNDLKTELQASLSKIAWLHVDGVRVMKETTAAGLSNAVTGSKDSAVMIAIADYHLSNDGKELYIVVNVNLYPNSAALAAFKPAGAKADAPAYDASNALYRNSFMFQSTLPGPPAKRDINMAAWSANNGATFRSAMELGVAKLSDMIAMDLQAGPLDPSASPSTSAAQASADPNGASTRQADGSLVYTAALAQ